MYRFPGSCLLWRINPEQEPEFAQNAPDYMPLRRQRLIRSIMYGGDPPCLRFDCGNFCAFCTIQFTFYLVDLMLYFTFNCDSISIFGINSKAKG
jgi:hypothetical protein